MKITNESLKVFLSHAADACNWNGTPMLEITKEQRGNLTQLKKAGLLTTFRSDGIDWVDFTEAGIELAKGHGITNIQR